ncbi:MAG: CRISPR-associated endonuclease Cas2 [Succinivibrionaceae bacterium]
MLVISYDISNNKIRTRFSKMLEKNGAIRIQMSVYEINQSNKYLSNIKIKIQDEFSKLFAPTDSVFIFKADMDKSIKYGSSIYHDKAFNVL